MAKQPKPQPNDNLSKDLINAADNSSSGNPGHESQSEGTTTAGEDPGSTTTDLPAGTETTGNQGPALEENLQPTTQGLPAKNEDLPAQEEKLPGANAINLDPPQPGPQDLTPEAIAAGLAAMPAEARAALREYFTNGPGKTEGDAPLFAGDPKDADADTLHGSREKTYGPDYVVATRGNNEQTVFTRLAWVTMRGDKGGWKEQVEVPAEIRELRKAKK